MNTKNKFSSLITLLLIANPIVSSAATQAVKSKSKAAVVRSKTEAAESKTVTVTPTPAEKTGSALPIKSGSVEFFALGRPSMLKIHGESQALGGSLTRSGNELTGELKIPLNSFTTGMTTRDNHLKEKVFETSKFDTAILTITSLTLPSASGVFKDLPFSGKLNLHGVVKDVKGTSQLTVSDATTLFAAHIEVKLTDYQITPPEFMGMSIQDDVKIDAKGETKAQL